MPFTAWQQAFDPLLTPGARNYWKSHDFADLPDGAIDVILNAVRRCRRRNARSSSPMSAAPRRAWPPTRPRSEPRRPVHHERPHALGRAGPGRRLRRLGARSSSRHRAVRARAASTSTSCPRTRADRSPTAYGANYRRLADDQGRYDPDNLFRMNQNIRPIPKAVAGAADAGRKASEAVAMGRRG